MSTADDMAHLEKVGISTDTTGWQMRFGQNHWKYPETVGGDTNMDDINFNSHDSSEYAIKRMNNTSAMTSEPFMLFEFMKIDEKQSLIKHKSQRSGFEDLSGIKFKLKPDKESAAANVKALEDAVGSFADNIRKFTKNLVSTAKRDYTGSIALYLPKDIAINDTMGYNEDTRKLGGLLESWSNETLTADDMFNATTLTDPTVLALAAQVGGILPIPAPVLAVIGGSIGTVASLEAQRATGKVLNPNELLRYQNTALRSFSFSWTILPDSENESKQAAGLIKFFRKSAHANKTSATMITVPDHVIASFHGGGAKNVGMIQLPPCYVEAVNVTYNPNNSSFFKQNNAPVEISLSITLKEIIPIYAHDVEAGY